MENILFGAAMIGEKFLFYHFKELKIKFFFDNYRQGEMRGYEIKKPYYDEKYFIIVTTNRYLEARTQLLGLGYKEFQDFIPYQIYKKEMVVMHGNCHMCAVKQYLETNIEFNRRYGIYPFPSIQEIGKNFDYKKILSHCDLFLHQAIRKENFFGEELSSENFIKYTSEKCCSIALPNLYGMPKCFFPQLDMSERRRRDIGSGFQYTIGHDKNIIKWIEENNSVEEVKKYIRDDGGVYSKEEILLMWSQFKVTLLNREKEWDIKISDYIFEHYKRKKLFYDPNHISDFLAREIAVRLLKALGYTEKIADIHPLMLDTWETYIYMDVMEALDLKFDQKYMRSCCRETSLNGRIVESDEYIENLYKWEMFCRK